MRVITYFHHSPHKPYKEMVKNLGKSAKELGYDFNVYEVTPEDIGLSFSHNNYYVNCSSKPSAIRKALDDYREDIAWVDADCIIKKNFDEALINCDVAVTLRKIEERKCGDPYFSGYINTGVVFFRNSNNTRKFLDLWEKEIIKIRSDQRAMNIILLEHSPLEKYNEIITIDEIRIKILEAQIYNFFYFTEDLSQAKILHYKGLLFKEYYK